MKSKHWIILMALLVIVCLALSLPLLRTGTPATRAEVKYGDTRMIVDLSEDREFTLPGVSGGYNTITVRGGKIAVTEADCPDQYCVRQGFCNSGVQIVCLPHGLVISFLDDSGIDGAAG